MRVDASIAMAVGTTPLAIRLTPLRSRAAPMSTSDSVQKSERPSALPILTGEEESAAGVLGRDGPPPVCAAGCDDGERSADCDALGSSSPPPPPPPRLPLLLPSPSATLPPHAKTKRTNRMLVALIPMSLEEH